jgi:hypothetical protein
MLKDFLRLIWRCTVGESVGESNVHDVLDRSAVVIDRLPAIAVDTMAFLRSDSSQSRQISYRSVVTLED